MDAHSRRTGFDEPILYLGDACHLEPIPCSKVYATCDTPRIFSACLVDESGSHDLTELTDLFGVGTYEQTFLQQLPVLPCIQLVWSLQRMLPVSGTYKLGT